MWQPGTLLNGRYRILEGIVGTSTLYRAEDHRRSGGVCWINELSLTAQTSDGMRTAPGLLHNALGPTVAPVHPRLHTVTDSFDELGSHYLVMAGGEGELLAARLERAHLGRLPIAEAIDILQQLLSILSELHTSRPPDIFGVLSPAAIVCLADGTIELLDWGSAPVTAAVETSVRSRDPVWGYAAPEQYEAANQVDARADVYSLGVLLAQMLTGYRPAAETSPFPMPLPHTLAPSMPDNLVGIIARATQLRPELRYADATEMQRALLASRSSPHSPATGTSFSEIAPTPGKAGRSRGGKGLWIGVGIAALLLLVCGGGAIGLHAAGLLSLSRDSQATARRPTQVVQIAVAPTQPQQVQAPAIEAQVHLTRTETNVPKETQGAMQITPTVSGGATLTETSDVVTAIAPPTETSKPEPTQPPESALQIAYVVGSVGNTDIYVADREGHSRVCVACRACDEAEPAWSPDGQSILYQSNCEGSYDIWRVDSQGGVPVRLTQTANLDEREPDAAPSGVIAYRVSPKDQDRNSDGELWIMNSDGTERRSLGIRGRSPTWSPNGMWLVFMSERDGGWDVYTHNYEMRATYRITECRANCRWPTWSPDGHSVVYHTTTAPGSVTADTIWMTSIESGEATQLATGHAAGRPSWSVEGIIAFNSNRGIEVIDQQGHNRRMLIADSDNWAPVWSR